MIETIKVKSVETKNGKNGAYYTIIAEDGSKGNCFDLKGNVDLAGKSVDFEVEVSGSFRNYKFKQVHAGAPEQQPQNIVIPAVNNSREISLKLAVDVAGKLNDVKVSGDDILKVAEKFNEYLSK